MEINENLLQLNFSLSWIQKKYPEVKWNNFQDIIFTQVHNDSRQILPGGIFFALAGVKEDGERYISDALNKGAVAFISEKTPSSNYSVPYAIVPSARKILAEISHELYGLPTEEIFLVGITGTNGKTTTSFFTHSILHAAGFNTGLLGTTGYFYGDHSFTATHTTPDSLVLNEHFARMKKEKISHAVMEVSSHSLALDRVTHLAYQAAIFTNLSRDHLDYHKDMDNYREAKALLFRGLTKKAIAVFNYDDPESFFIQKVCPARPIWFGLKNVNGVMVYARNIEETNTSTKFELVTPNGTIGINLFFPGLYNVYNALAASACCWAMGISLEMIAKGLQHITKVPGRMQRVPNNKGFDVFIDFAHTDQALERALSTLQKIKKNRLLVVFGCGGDRDSGKRPLMGKVAEHYADYTWITSDNPRTENPEKIISDILNGFKNTNKYEVCIDRQQAIEKAIHTATNGDIVIIAGKGHETGQIIGNKVIPFSDEEVARQCLNIL